MSDFDETFDFASDSPAGKDPDESCPTLRRYHCLLWSKPLRSGEFLTLEAPKVRRQGYTVASVGDGRQWWLGSDAITNSYTRWTRPKSLADAIASLTDEQRARYLDPPYTPGSTMVWPVRSADRPTINQARGTRSKIDDRMDLTLECIRRHYAGHENSPLADVLSSYGDFFALFSGFGEFVEFFHFQDLVSTDRERVEFFLPFDDFSRRGAPATCEEYIEYRESVLTFVERRQRRIGGWVRSQKA